MLILHMLRQRGWSALLGERLLLTAIDVDICGVFIALLLFVQIEAEEVDDVTEKFGVTTVPHFVLLQVTLQLSADVVVLQCLSWHSCTRMQRQIDAM
jgi:hypothetical protein